MGLVASALSGSTFLPSPACCAPTSLPLGTSHPPQSTVFPFPLCSMFCFFLPRSTFLETQNQWSLTSPATNVILTPGDMCVALWAATTLAQCWASLWMEGGGVFCQGHSPHLPPGPLSCDLDLLSISPLPPPPPGSQDANHIPRRVRISPHLGSSPTCAQCLGQSIYPVCL